MCSSADLTEQGVAEADADGLVLGVVVEGLLAELAADAARLVASKWKLVVEHVVLL